VWQYGEERVEVMLRGACDVMGIDGYETKFTIHRKFAGFVISLSHFSYICFMRGQLRLRSEQEELACTFFLKS
jgi:hypothetical protein